MAQTCDRIANASLWLPAEPAMAESGGGRRLVGEVGLEPTKAKPADLQSAPFAARDIPPFANFMKSQAKLQVLHFSAEHPRAGVMVTPLLTVNRKRPSGVPGEKASHDHSLRPNAHRRAQA